MALTKVEVYKGYVIWTNGLYYYCHALKLFEYHSLTALKGQITVRVNRKKICALSKVNTSEQCKHGHKGRMRLNNQGYWICRECHEVSNVKYRKAEREREKRAYNVLRNAF